MTDDAFTSHNIACNILHVGYCIVRVHHDSLTPHCMKIIWFQSSLVKYIAQSFNFNIRILKLRKGKNKYTP